MPPPTFLLLPGLYEASAILQLPDGRFLVAEDEKSHPLSLLRLADNEVRVVPMRPGLFDFDGAFWKLDDLEGLALDAHGRVLAITSHSRNSDGEAKKSREKLVRFRVEDDTAEARQLATGLKDALVMAHPWLATAAAEKDVKGHGGLNIEAIEFDPHDDTLWLGLRSPLREGKALLARLVNVDAVFDEAAKPAFASELVALDLGGEGLRGMAWVPALSAFLLIAGPVAREARDFNLWRWSGRPGASAQRVGLPGLTGFRHAEGICPARLDGRDCLLIVSDDGHRETDEPAHYLVVEACALQELR